MLHICYHRFFYSWLLLYFDGKKCVGFPGDRYVIIAIEDSSPKVSTICRGVGLITEWTAKMFRLLQDQKLFAKCRCVCPLNCRWGLVLHQKWVGIDDRITHNQKLHIIFSMDIFLYGQIPSSLSLTPTRRSCIANPSALLSGHHFSVQLGTPK